MDETTTPPGTTPTTTGTPNPTPPAGEPTADDKRAAARLAMEGPERHARREHAEKIASLTSEITTVSNRLDAIAAEKERLELAWVDLSEKLEHVKKNLAPITAEEKAIETEEGTLEESEARTPNPADRRGIEEKRWHIEQKRHDVEAKKWIEEADLLAIQATVDSNTKTYQSLLDEEEALRNKLAELKKSVQ